MEKITVSMLQTGGMALVITLCNKGFIIVDGGDEAVDYPRHSTVLMNFLRERTKTEKIPVLGWFFTHFHYDHTSLAARFLTENRDVLDVKGFFINPHGGVGDDNDLLMKNQLLAAIENYPGAEVHYLKTGEKLSFPLCTADVFLTSEDDSPFGRINQNFVSAAFKFTFKNGKSFFVTGDCDNGRLLRLTDPADPLYRPSEELKSDLLQMPHHGLPLYHDPNLEGKEEFVKRVAPSVALFPVGEARFKTDERFRESRWADNYYILHSGADYYYSEETVTVEMG